jgi:hypothetical protein
VTDDADEPRLNIAAWRYRLIASALEAPPDSLTAALAQTAATNWCNLRGQQDTVSLRTLWRWVKAYRQGGLLALAPKVRSDRGQLRAFCPEVLERAGQLRRDNPRRATPTIIDLLERNHEVPPGSVTRSTLDHHLDRAGLSRARLRTLGRKTFRKILTQAPFELVIADFHHGPYVLAGPDNQVRRSLLPVFLDHYSRFVLEARYYLHEDFAALRFGFRRVLLAHGCFARLYLDNGPTFHSTAFHAACTHPCLAIELVHSKPYAAEGRGACERINRTVDEQFESEVRARRELLNLEERERLLRRLAGRALPSRPPPRDRAEPPGAFRPSHHLPALGPALGLGRRAAAAAPAAHRPPQMEHRGARRPALRGRPRPARPASPGPLRPVRPQLRPDPVRRPDRPAGTTPPGRPPAPGPAAPDLPKATPTDYLALLRADHEARRRAELSALRLRAPGAPPELPLVDLCALLELCRGSALLDLERSEAAALWRKLRPIDPAHAQDWLGRAQRRLGSGLHLRCYLDDLRATLVRLRTKGELK